MQKIKKNVTIILLNNFRCIMLSNFLEFLQSPTAYHVCDKAKSFLLKNGFQPLSEREDWELEENGKYFVERNGTSIIAFTIGAFNDFSYKIVASHSDSPALKLKENPVKSAEGYQSLNVEPYGGGIWNSFLDRPLKIAGRVIVKREGKLCFENVEAPFLVTIPSVAIHQNRSVNQGVAINEQVDLLPLLSLKDGKDFMEKLCNGEVVSHDLYVVNADTPYSFGVNGEFLASPRIDNITGVSASLESLVSSNNQGICIAAIFDNEEVGSRTMQGAAGNFLETVLKRIAYALRFDENEYCKALASSFLLSVDNGHALHPNHPEKTDPTNRPVMGGGVLLKSHSQKAYTTDGVSSAIVKTLFENANVKYQTFFNRSDAKSGSTLGVSALSSVSIFSADVGLAQLAMHSACECMAKSDYSELVHGISALFESNVQISETEIEIF